MGCKIIGIIVCLLLVSSTNVVGLTPVISNEHQTLNPFFTLRPIPLSSKGWMKSFGGAKDEGGNCVQQTDDSGYIITGYVYSFGAGSFDVWLIKTDSQGNKMWDRTFGGKSGDFGNAVQQTTDGGYIITGSLSWDKYLYLIKTDRNGNMLWYKTFGGLGEEEGRSVQETNDGGYIITGYTNSYGAGDNDVWLIKTDNNGNKIWDMTFGGPSQDCGTVVQQTTDSGYIITGYTNSFGAGNNDLWLIKTDSQGNKVWDRTFGGIQEDRGYFVQETTDSGYILTGFTYLFNSPDVWLIKTDQNGNKMWESTFGGKATDMGNSVQQTTDDGYIITGFTESFGEDYADVWLIKTDNNGNKMWDSTFGTSSMEFGNSVHQTTDGGYILTGVTLTYSGGCDIWLIKTDSQGKSKTTLFDTLCLELLFSSKLIRFLFTK